MKHRRVADVMVATVGVPASEGRARVRWTLAARETAARATASGERPPFFAGNSISAWSVLGERWRLVTAVSRSPAASACRAPQPARPARASPATRCPWPWSARALVP